MRSGDARMFQREAWDRLFELVVMRNNLLRRLDRAARVAMDITPATGTVVEFDTTQARDLLAAIDELMPRITAALEEVNGYAEQTGSPRVRWQSVRSDYGI